MTAPAFILSSTSLTEFSAYWAEHPSVFVAPTKEKDPQKRALLVLKWFLSTLKQQYSSRNEKLGSEKKPLNPFLGELFLGKWEDQEGVTQLVSEQVRYAQNAHSRLSQLRSCADHHSHHPPVTAYCIWNNDHGIRLQGYNAQKASFSRTIHVKQIGHALLHLDKFDEYYLITLPSLHIEGLISGSPYVELNKHTYIQSSTGYTAKIDYSGKGWLSGKKNTFTATMYPEGREKDVLYTVEGQWTDGFTIRDGKKNVVDTYSAKLLTKTPLKIANLEDQDPMESRRAWLKVAQAIEKGDLNATGIEKTKIEESQRELRRREKEEGREWERRFFTRVNSYPQFEALAKKIGEAIDADKTNGVWKFDQAKAMGGKPPFAEATKPNVGGPP